MKFIRSLLAKNEDDHLEFNDLDERPISDLRAAQKASADLSAQVMVKDDKVVAMAPDTGASNPIHDQVNADVGTGGASPVNIWDMDGESAAPEPAPAPAPRRRRNKTRLLGYEHLEDEAVSAFENAGKTAATARAMFPVGWVVVAEGPGRGNCFTLEAGMSQIGRGEDQAIQLDFGDNSISRMNHAAIVYDPETHDFLLGHGGKKNIVRLNGKPVISNEVLATGDEIHIGETKLRFTALCTSDFNWADESSSGEESENVAIA